MRLSSEQLDLTNTFEEAEVRWTLFSRPIIQSTLPKSNPLGLKKKNIDLQKIQLTRGRKQYKTEERSFVKDFDLGDYSTKCKFKPRQS